MNKKVSICLVIILIILIGTVIGYRVYMDSNEVASNETNNSQVEETTSPNSTQTNSVDVNDYYAEEDLTVVQTGEETNINLWHEGNIPTTTNYTQNNGNYFDDPDFMPCIKISCPITITTSCSKSMWCSFEYMSFYFCSSFF